MLYERPDISNMSNFEMQSNIDGNNNTMYNDVDVDVNMNSSEMGNMENTMGGCCEPVRERCIHRTFVHEVPHACPIRTRIINHHVYKHTYHPEYSCCEENVVSNVQCGSCNQFR